jgi:hypothetical protein
MVLLVAAAGLAVWRFSGTPVGGGNGGGGGAGEPGAARPRLVAGNDYYLHVKLIELAERAPGGSVWDRVDDSGPDVGFRLTWRGNVVWDGSVKPDTLIGSWDLMKIDLRQVIASGGKAELEGALNAPLVHYQPGEAVELTVWDDDPVGSDDAGKLTLKLDDLGPGENTLAPTGEGAGAVKRVVFALIDRRTPVPQLLETMSNR